MARDHHDLLAALQQAQAASAVQEQERALQKDFGKRAKEDLRRLKWHSGALKDSRTMFLILNDPFMLV